MECSALKWSAAIKTSPFSPSPKSISLPRWWLHFSFCCQITAYLFQVVRGAVSTAGRGSKLHRTITSFVSCGFAEKKKLAFLGVVKMQRRKYSHSSCYFSESTAVWKKLDPAPWEIKHDNYFITESSFNSQQGYLWCHSRRLETVEDALSLSPPEADLRLGAEWYVWQRVALKAPSLHSHPFQAGRHSHQLYSTFVLCAPSNSANIRNGAMWKRARWERWPLPPARIRREACHAILHFFLYLFMSHWKGRCCQCTVPLLVLVVSLPIRGAQTQACVCVQYHCAYMPHLMVTGLDNFNSRL